MELTIEAMTCHHCAARITRAIHGVDPDARVEVDLPSHRVKVDADSDRDAIIAALHEAGYPPK